MKNIANIPIIGQDQSGKNTLAMQKHKMQKIKGDLRHKHDKKVQGYIQTALEYNNIPVNWDNVKCRVTGLGFIFMYIDLPILIASHMQFKTKEKRGKLEYQIHQDFVPMDYVSDQDKMTNDEIIKYMNYKNKGDKDE